jgi:Fe2+ transport system protein FeoA
MEDQRLVSLEQLKSGAHGIIRQFQAGKELTSRLAAMGLSVGSEFKILQNQDHGPVLVLARDTRIAIGRGQAVKILVEELQGEQREKK